MAILGKKGEIENSSPCRSLVVYIQEELRRLPQMSQRQKRCIYRVPRLLRQVKEEAYTPVVVSIGLFHHKNERLLPMETHKLMYLQSFIQRSVRFGCGDLNTYIDIIIDKESQIRECYAEDIHLCSDEFVRMVLIDGIFIIELLRTREVVMPFTPLQLFHDLMLVENQLPFFILKDLYSAAFKQEDDDDDHMSSTCAVSLTHLACEFFSVDKSRVEVDPCHLLDLRRRHYLPPDQETNTTQDGEKNHHMDIDHRGVLFPTAMSLYEAGVKFCVSSKPWSLLDIHFDKEKGLLTIPKLLVADSTESLFRNLEAFEQCHYYPNNSNYITDYLFFMDCLINTWEDVQLLSTAGIIHNWLGSEKEVADLINSLGTNIVTSSSSYYYASITEQLNDHCNKRWNRYRATLKHTYFKHPWAVLSVIYAVILLLLTIAQLLTGILAVPGVKK